MAAPTEVTSVTSAYKFVRTSCNALLGKMSVYQLNDTMRTLSLSLGIKEQSLSGLAGVGSDPMGRVGFLEINLQPILGNGLILEVKESLSLEEAIQNNQRVVQI